MVTEIIHELTAIKDKSMATSEQVLAWASQVESQRSRTAILDSLRETRDLNTKDKGVQNKKQNHLAEHQNKQR